MPIVQTLRESFVFKRGDSWPPFSFNVKDEVGVIAFLSGASILMQIKNSPKDTVAIKTFTNTTGFIVENNVATLDFLSVINDLAVGKYYYDIQVTFPNGLVRTVFEGDIRVKQDTSR